MTEYILLDTNQTQFIKNLCKTLKIDIQDIFQLKDLKEEKEVINKRLLELENALIQQNQVIRSLNETVVELHNQLQEALYGDYSLNIKDE